MFVCMIVWGVRANQRHTRHHCSSRVCEWSLHARARACWQQRQKRKEISTHPHASVHTCAHRSSTASQGCASVESVCCYYFANPSTVSVCLSVNVRPCVLMLAYTILRSSPSSTHIWCWVNQLSYPLIRTHTHTTFSTVTQAQYSVNCHEKHTNSPRWGKPGKNAGWQGRQLVVVQRKIPVSRRNRELGNQVCMFGCLIVWGATANQHRTRHHRSSRVYFMLGISCWVKQLSYTLTLT
jgi:hypothetical protein